MPRGQKTVSQGGIRRSFCLPCGKVIQGQPIRLKGAISAHQKVCLKCAGSDCSSAWKKPVEDPHLNCLQGSNSGNNRHQSSAPFRALNSETGEERREEVIKVGGAIDTILAARESLQNPPADTRPNKKKKGGAKKNKEKKERPAGRGSDGRPAGRGKVQSDWGAIDDKLHDLFGTISTFEESDGDLGALIEIDEDNLDDVMRVINSLTGDLNPDEIEFRILRAEL